MPRIARCRCHRVILMRRALCVVFLLGGVVQSVGFGWWTTDRIPLTTSDGEFSSGTFHANDRDSTLFLVQLNLRRTCSTTPDDIFRHSQDASDLPSIHTRSYGSRISMRLPNATHESRPWRIREIAPDFTVEDVWALPVHGGAEDFQTLLEIMTSGDPVNAESLATRVLWRVRFRVGSWFGWDDAASKLPIPGTNETSLTGRLPDDLRNTAADLVFGSLPFTPLYRTNIEFAAELSNQTVHAVMHLAWVDQGEGRYQGQMAVYVKPRGPLGKGYMALIAPFRHWVVYPALMQQIERAWNTRVPR
jgi:hypothetical protein